MFSIKIEGLFRPVDGMPKEYYCEQLKELKIIGKCIRIISTNSNGSCDTSTYNIKKEDLIAITSTYEGTYFLFKDIYIRIKYAYGFKDQINSIIKSEIEGNVEPSIDLIGLNS